MWCGGWLRGDCTEDAGTRAGLVIQPRTASPARPPASTSRGCHHHHLHGGIVATPGYSVLGYWAQYGDKVAQNNIKPLLYTNTTVAALLTGKYAPVLAV